KVAIITGGGRGIGKAYALAYAAEGARVVIADIVFENAQKVAEEIKSKGGTALPLPTDVSSEASTREMAKKTVEAFGKIDVLLNNAAVFYGLEIKSWDDRTTEEWGKMFAVNVTGCWLCAKAVVPYMNSGGKGKIINISSTTADTGMYHIIHYACSKGAVMTLTKCLAKALGKQNINVNSIAPGYTIDEATLLALGGKEDAADRSIQGRAMRRREYPADLVGTAVYLASADSDFVTGQIITVDGGEVMR
ncbi:MAG: SDR family oxidoreductase, partial [Dehalococcoidia bacterium]|nr:SDR family oxidoreductase [Dehalococcoidia bacterium]